MFPYSKWGLTRLLYNFKKVYLFKYVNVLLISPSIWLALPIALTICLLNSNNNMKSNIEMISRNKNSFQWMKLQNNQIHRFQIPSCRLSINFSWVEAGICFSFWSFSFITQMFGLYKCVGYTRLRPFPVLPQVAYKAVAHGFENMQEYIWMKSNYWWFCYDNMLLQ